MKIHPNHTRQQLAAGKIAIGMGMRMRFILSGNDTGFLMAGATARANFLRGIPL